MFKALKRLITFDQGEFSPIITPEIRKICLDMTEGVKYSPDLGWLEQYEFQLLFVPDELKMGHER